MRTEVKLSKRLERIASFVQPGSRVADIGTDHGYVPIWLVQKGVCPSALAMDVRKGPLERAEEHVEEVGLSGKIELRLSDGLAKLKAGEADTVVIAGMGGKLTCRILEQGRHVWENWRRRGAHGLSGAPGHAVPPFVGRFQAAARLGKAGPRTGKTTRRTHQKTISNEKDPDPRNGGGHAVQLRQQKQIHRRGHR